MRRVRTMVEPAAFVFGFFLSLILAVAIALMIFEGVALLLSEGTP